MPTTATITAPAAPTTVVQGQVLQLAADAVGGDLNPLTGASVVWSSSVHGKIGEGSTLNFHMLGPGVHTITVTATDDQDSTDTDTVQVTVRPRPHGSSQRRRRRR